MTNTTSGGVAMTPNYDGGRMSLEGALIDAEQYRSDSTIINAQDQLTIRLENACEIASKELKRLSGGGPMGLTPDTVKATPEYQSAKRAYQKAFAALRQHNAERNSK